MTLQELFTAVRDEHLGKAQLEKYEQELAALYAQYMLEIADLKKAEAMFFFEKTSPDVTDISIKRLWRATEKGQLLIQREAEVKAVSKMLSSVKSRIYQTLNY